MMFQVPVLGRSARTLSLHRMTWTQLDMDQPSTAAARDRIYTMAHAMADAPHDTQHVTYPCKI